MQKSLSQKKHLAFKTRRL